jgi:hypothetical protein
MQHKVTDSIGQETQDMDPVVPIAVIEDNA